MLISYYANKKSSPRLPSWQPSLIFFNIPIESGSIIKPCTLKHFQVTYRLHKAGYWTSIGSDNGLSAKLSPIRCQVIIWTNAGLLLIGPNIVQWNFNRKWNIFIHENAFGNVVCKMSAISFQSQCVKTGMPEASWCRLQCLALEH